MLVEHVEHGPKYDVDALLLAVGDESRQVDVGNRIHDVAFRRVIPSFIEHDILQAEAGSEVNIVFVGFGVDACLEFDPSQIPVVPPVPSHLSGLDPVGLSNLVRGGKRIDEVVDGHLRVLLAHGKHAPGIGSCTRRLGNEFLRLADIRHAPPLVVLHLFGVGCKQGI